MAIVGTKARPEYLSLLLDLPEDALRNVISHLPFPICTQMLARTCKYMRLLMRDRLSFDHVALMSQDAWLWQPFLGRQFAASYANRGKTVTLYLDPLMRWSDISQVALAPFPWRSVHLRALDKGDGAKHVAMHISPTSDFHHGSPAELHMQGLSFSHLTVCRGSTFSHLTVLKMESVSIRTDMLDALLSLCPSLLTLSMLRCALFFPADEDIDSAEFPFPPRLETLSIESTQLACESTVVDMMLALPYSLRCLSLSGSEPVNDFAVDSIISSEANTSVESLFMDRCTSVSPTAVERLIQSLPGLKMVHAAGLDYLHNARMVMEEEETRQGRKKRRRKEEEEEARGGGGGDGVVRCQAAAAERGVLFFC
eukprot:CAMPEP_0113882806 /NCGR_PEP_ID=MMETSP0780_2-20120614/9193_1 /TAXON_ID=652834 /ORGANISM="Palpitomonas bilix" /LENGTH=367 /DNA_ID=CAMNT_0000869929 /DNA_START=162 /DNA_END=1265 /DNA_ORIENTATION=+ /assembly_acc=CAM_ASM_000599